MNAENEGPKTLLEAVTYFADPDVALQFVATLRWPHGVSCPECQSKRITFLKTRRIWKCRDCKRQFSAKVGTIFEDSPISLSKWLPAMWLIANCKNGISSYELARALKVTQKTAWFMLHRIRRAMQTETFGKLGGWVEADETFIGGLAKNMHHEKRKRVIKGPGGAHAKVAVMGLLERHGHAGRKHSTVRAKVVKSLRKRTLQQEVRDNVHTSSYVYTDSAYAYRGLDSAYVHRVIDHAKTYVQGQVHTNGIENFWSLLKRTLKGTYVSVDPFHLFRYLDEQVFRFNNRKDTDAGRFLRVAFGILGKRLTYDELVGAGMSSS